MLNITKFFKKENHLEVFQGTGVTPRAYNRLALLTAQAMPLTDNPILPLDPRQSVFSVPLYF